MDKAFLIFSIIGLLDHALVSAQKCPKLARTSPALIKPKNCPSWSSVPKSVGSLKDNECLIGGILGGDFFNACFAPDMSTGLAGMALGGGNRVEDWSGGSGPYKARYYTDSSLPRHTIYAPVKVSSKRLPLLVWANGACDLNGAAFSNYLTEIASHGFMVVANGNPRHAWGGKGSGGPSPAPGEKSRASMLTQSIDWAERGAAGGKYGTVDMSKVGVGGQSCGGIESYSASVYDKRVKATGIFNTGVIDPGRRWYLGEMKQPVGLFYGGQQDFAAKYIEQDYKDLPKSLPVMMSSLPNAGHLGTYSQRYGGKFGHISVEFWKWQLLGDVNSKQMFFNKSSSLYKDGWKINTAHWIE